MIAILSSFNSSLEAPYANILVYQAKKDQVFDNEFC